MIEVGAAIIYNSENKILIARRPEESAVGSVWEFPGGKREENETMEQCVIRELIEEMEIKVDILSFFCEETIHSKINGKIYKMFFYKCKYNNDEIKLNDHVDYKWIDICEIHNFEFSEADLNVAKKLELEC